MKSFGSKPIDFHEALSSRSMRAGRTGYVDFSDTLPATDAEGLVQKVPSVMLSSRSCSEKLALAFVRDRRTKPCRD
jgi:hypothetical protein